MTSAVTTKSGKGLSYGVVSELATYWEVLPGRTRTSCAPRPSGSPPC